MDAHVFLKSLTMVLCVAAVTTVVFQRLKQPVVLGYILAGLIVGPHVAVPLVADPRVVEALSELGVILLMFSLGLEFSLGKLAKVGPTAGVTAFIQCALMVWFGFLVGRFFGWTTHESLFTGGVIAISSTTIIAKAFDEQGIKGKLREFVVGVLIVEDLIGILLMAVLTAISGNGADGGISSSALLAPAGRLAVFLVAFIVLGLLIVPRAIRAVNRFGRPETMLVTSIGLCFGGALLAHELGYSVALGAFIAGSLVSESGQGEKIEHLIEPVRDMFAAIFFVSVGMLIDPSLVWLHWAPIAVLTVVVIVGKVFSVTTGAFLTGSGTRTSVQAGFSLAQIGEFSFIIAALGLSLKATGTFLYPIAVAVSAVTTLTTPWLIRASGPAANFVDRKLPKSLQTFAALYGSWIEQLRSAPNRETTGTAARRLIKLILLDAAVLAGLIIATAVYGEAGIGYIAERWRLSPVISSAVLAAGFGFLALPFAVGIVRMAKRLGTTLAEAALPKKVEERQVDLAMAPRKALVVTLQFVVLLAVGLPLLALTQPFLPAVSSAAGVVVLIAIGVVLLIAFWRGAANLQGHVRAGSEMIVEVLATQTQKGGRAAGDPEIDLMHKVLPGLGDPVPVRLNPGSAAVGKTLAQLNLRGLTGATVLAISRAGHGIIAPTARESLQDGDILALAGTHEAVEDAKSLLEFEREVFPADLDGEVH